MQVANLQTDKLIITVTCLPRVYLVHIGYIFYVWATRAKVADAWAPCGHEGPPITDECPVDERECPLTEWFHPKIC